MNGDDLRASVARVVEEEFQRIWRVLTGNEDVVVFGPGAVIERKTLVRILKSASFLAGRAYEWEESSDRRRHSVQLRRLTTLDRNLYSLARLVAGEEVVVSEGDILSITEAAGGEDTREQRHAPRVDISGSIPEQHAKIYQALRLIQANERSGAYITGRRNLQADIQGVLDGIRNSGGHSA